MRGTLLALAIAVCGVASAQTFPFELEADRKPTIQTKGDCLIRGGYVLTATRGNLENTDILITNGKIAAIGRGLTAPPGHTIIDARGKVVCPGFVDGHSHRGSDGTNEGSDSITGEVRIGDVLNLSALNVWQAVASGHTSALILHGSANSVGGQSVVIKYKYMRPNTEGPISTAPRMIKFALGENVTRKTDTGTNPRFPRTRMGVEAVYRRGFTEARQYMQDWDDFRSGKRQKPPRRDLRLETLADILRQKIWVQCHSYRSDEMLMLVRLSQEFGFKIGAMQHALEAYKIAPEMAKAGVGASIFVDNWSFKQEGYDAIPWNAAICVKAGVSLSINTDGTGGTTALNIDAAKVMRFGGLTEQQALQTITINPAKQLGIDHRTGSIEVGKDADLGIWDGHPLSVYSKVRMTLIEGEVFFQRRDKFNIDGSSTIKAKLDPAPPQGEPAVPKRSNVYAVVGADIHRVSGPMIRGGTVVVRNGKIAAVGSGVAVPAGTTVVDGRGMSLYPGFIDAYTNMGLLEISPIPVMTDSSELGSFQPDLDALTGLWVESAHYGPALYNGVTNAFTAPGGGTLPGMGSVINTFGFTSEGFGVSRRSASIVSLTGIPRLPEFDQCDDTIDLSYLLGMGGDEKQGGHSHGHGQGHNHGDEHLTVAQRELAYGILGGQVPDTGPESNPATEAISSYFDRALAYYKARQSDAKTRTDTNFEALRPYLTSRKLMIISVRNAATIRSAVALAQKYKLNIALRGASEAWRETRLLRENKIPVILNPAGRTTLGANIPDNSWDPYDTMYVVPTLLARAGVKFCFATGSGSDSMTLPVRAGQHAAYGLSRDGIIRALTLNAAEILGVGKELGSIDAGKRATFFLASGDPLEMTGAIRYVFVDGQPVPLRSKHTMLRDKYMQRP